MIKYQAKHDRTKASVLERGGIVERFTIGEEEIFYPWRITDPKKGVMRGGCFGCAPWFGSSSRGEKKHGFLRDTLAYSVEDDDEDRIAMNLYHHGSENYPWNLMFATDVRVRDRSLYFGLSILRQFDNVAGEAPVLPGLHPFFACRDASKVEVWLGRKMYQGFSSEARQIPLDETLVLINIPGERIIRIDLSMGFFIPIRSDPQLVLWTDAPDKYFCVEPILYPKELFDTLDGHYLVREDDTDIGMWISVE
jgi:D-hexose-6-phosphate mutarotase